MKAVGYVRVSTKKQASEGISLEAQRKKILKYCLAHEYKLADIYGDEGISGGDDDRQGLRDALNALSRGDILVVASLSRLARSTKKTIEVGEELAKRGADLVSLSEKIDTTSAAGKMVFRMLAVLAEFERDLIVERINTTVAHQRALGKRLGEIPYGKKLGRDNYLVDDKNEVKIIKEVKQLVAGGASYSSVAKELNNRGVKARGKSFWPQTIKNIASRRD